MVTRWPQIMRLLGRRWARQISLAEPIAPRTLGPYFSWSLASCSDPMRLAQTTTTTSSSSSATHTTRLLYFHGLVVKDGVLGTGNGMHTSSYPWWDRKGRVQSLSSSAQRDTDPSSTGEPPTPPSASTSSSSKKEAAATTHATTPSTTTTTTAPRVSAEEIRQEETQRRRLSDVLISEVLKAKHAYRWVDPVVPRTATVREAIVIAIEGGLSGMMVLDQAGDRHRVVGLVTSRDLLRIMAAGIKAEESDERILSRVVGDFMTPISQVIYARPDETVGMCRTIMAKLGVKCLPILSREGQVEGLITARDMSDFGLSAKDKGGKKSYLNDVSERVGLSSDTSMAEPPSYLKAHLALERSPLYLNYAVAALPHPFKSAQGLGRDQNDTTTGLQVLSNDPTLSEDSYFITSVQLPDVKDKVMRNYIYMGVADGVGSWREYGVDPRHFSRKLMEECQNLLQEASRNGQTDGQKFRQVIGPAEIMAQAYERVKAENIVGSSTACIALFDSIRHQIHFSNLGDCGILVLRHIDSDIAGALKRDRQVPRLDRKSDLRLAFVSQQQLRSFNHPFQLGWTGQAIPEGEKTSFKTAREACTSSIHVRRGDIVIMATDGLFDNVDVDDICAMALEWEQRFGFIRGGDTSARESRWAMGNSLTHVSAEAVGPLAEALCLKARENSLNPLVDSPFAILAKENDIMWSGGMPDDCTVIVMHVVGRDANDYLDHTNM